jgi:deoxyribodipyrimidine photolyase-related protein
MPSVFARQLAALNTKTPTPSGYVFVAYDQLHPSLFGLDDIPASTCGVVVVECPEKTTRRPYHQQKLALVLSSVRHFALEVAASGRRVLHVVSDGDYATALRRVAQEHGPLWGITPAERELRVDLAPLVDEGALTLRPHPGWLSTADDFRAASKNERGPWRMDAFYREVRRRTGWLMDARGKPEGGRFSFDGDNRQAWPGTPTAPTPPRFDVDDVTAEVVDLVRTKFGTHPGDVDAGAIPATADDVNALWGWAKAHCLSHFGPFEDAMSERSRGLFHSRISAVMNLHRLLPADMVHDVLRLEIPFSSKEGFLRQVAGWREFVHHVHVATDGFRDVGGVGGVGHDVVGTKDGSPNVLGAHAALPPAFWPATWGGAPSGLRCLDVVVDNVWAEAYSHHITRLMVLANIATLLDISPRALTDWFWVAYADAFDWVVEPNVLGMGTFAAGDVMTTKPYIAGSAYIDKMSDHCGRCAFHPKKAPAEGGCPLTSLYWAFLGRHQDVLSDNDRMKLPMGSWRRRTEAQRQHDDDVFQITSKALASKERLEPAHFGAGKNAETLFDGATPPPAAGKKRRRPDQVNSGPKRPC